MSREPSQNTYVHTILNEIFGNQINVYVLLSGKGIAIICDTKVLHVKAHRMCL